MNDKEKKQIKRVKKNVKRLAKKIKRKRKPKKPRTKRVRVDNMYKSGLNAVALRDAKNSKQSLRNVQMFRKYSRNQYLFGLIHPEEAVKRQIPLKLPSDLPIPTSSIGFHEQYQLSTGSAGTFLLSWRPNFLGTTVSLTNISCNDFSRLTFNNSSLLTGLTLTTGNSFISGTYIPAVDLQRYRLVSAIIKVQYNGSILSQAGTFLSCITFDSTRIAIGSTTNPVNTLSDSLMDRFGNFSLIANGLWNQTVDVTTHGSGLQGLYVPMDPLDVAFDRINAYYGNTPSSNGLLNSMPEGAPQTYVFCGRNLPVNSSCILIDVYYNFEVIADPSVAPILRSSSNDVPSKKEGREAGDVMSEIFQDIGFMNVIPNEKSTDSLFDKFLEVGLKAIPNVISAFL